MIWNPWKEIKRLRDQVDLYNEMAMNEGFKAVSRQYDKEVLQGGLAALNEKREEIEDLLHAALARTDKLSKALQAIAAMETPRCSNVVRKITRMARETLGK